MPRIKLFTEEVALKKAMELFWAKGYHNTSIQDLVDYLGVNRSSLYHAFGDKKNLFDTSFEFYMNSNYEMLKKTLSSTNYNVKKNLSEFFKGVISAACSNEYNKGCFVVNTTTELLPEDSEVKKIVKRYNKNIEELFYNSLLTGFEKGELNRDVDLHSMAKLLFTFLVGFSVVGKTMPDKDESIAALAVLLSLLDGHG